MMAVAIVSQNVTDIGELYPYPIMTNGSHVCHTWEDYWLNEETTICEWILNDNFTEMFVQGRKIRLNVLCTIAEAVYCLCTTRYLEKNLLKVLA